MHPLVLLLLLLMLQGVPALASEKEGPPKVSHAEPLFIDLIRDLGARKGEREWNVALGLSDQTRFDRYEALVEYEWAPVHRLGLEIEAPMTFYPGAANGGVPSNRLEGLKTAAQWTFAVSPRRQASFALGYINELKMTDLDRVGRSPLFKGNVYNPFVVGAKRLGANWHSLVYTGPRVTQPFRSGQRTTAFDLNASVHYMLESRNFVGIEVNKTWQTGDADLTLRPQMRLAINDRFLVGILTGVPVQRDRERLSTFVRLIYEPKHR